ncbi:dipeptidase [Aquirufa aurantiipilula]|uniref:Membrane dipeptidase n=1 Tax=Aquirufa aurantiipilula TaxID=2696561 RepID=A0ABT6BGW4_9BACT|nr:membrane dipeptidase [Aquirufa aurantiipilula]MDF5689702.1 membrane dipeptidase [Aquirufa aurantiipilula]
MLLFDAHLDLSMNALEWNRDLRSSLQDINEREKGMTDKPDRGNAVISLDELRKGNIGIVVATQIARYVDKSSTLPGWHSPEQAWAQTQGQLAYYKALETLGELSPIRNWEELQAHVEYWNNSQDTKKKIGYILSLEGADSIITVDHLDIAYNYGLRALGPAHYGPGRYAQGTNATGGLGEAGRALLARMQQLGIILDATHLCDDSFWEAMEHYDGPVWASHHNCRALVNHNRQFTDEQFKELIRRGAVIGMPLDAWMMVPNWVRGVSTPQNMQVSLNTMIDHLDHICQIAGNTNHVGLGTDLDGGFGTEQCPYDIQSIADLQKIPDLLSKRGYSSDDIEKICHKNWIGFLEKNWK